MGTRYNSLDEYPKKKMLVIDILKFIYHKEILTIVDADEKVLFNDRAEYLIHDENGNLSDLCWREVYWFEVFTSCTLCIYLQEECNEGK